MPGARCSTECSALFKARAGIRNYGTEKTKLANWEALNGLNDQKREKPKNGLKKINSKTDMTVTQRGLRCKTRGRWT